MDFSWTVLSVDYSDFLKFTCSEQLTAKEKSFFSQEICLYVYETTEKRKPNFV